MAKSCIFVKFFLSIALTLLVRAQSASSSTISSVTAISSNSAYVSSSSSQMAWWNKTWDVVVVGSGPAGIIGKIPFFSIPRTLSALSVTSLLSVVPVNNGFCLVLTIVGSCVQMCCVIVQYVCSPNGGWRPVICICRWYSASRLVEWGKYLSGRLSWPLQLHLR